jgi:hypothetical protein
MFAKKPEMAKEWAAHTPDTKNLPEKKKVKHMKKSEIVNFVILEKALDNKHFKIDRADDCIWLTDKRGKKARIIHLVPDQAKEVGSELINISKSQVADFYRYRKGHIERVKGWLMPERYGRTGYEPTTTGVMTFIQDHMSIGDYGKLLQRAAKESTYIMEAVNSAYLDVADKAKGTLEKLARTNMPALKTFLTTLFNQVQEDVLSIRKDLRKAKK